MKKPNKIVLIFTCLSSAAFCGFMAHINPLLGISSLPIAAIIGWVGGRISKNIL
jgi:hypothetical protein